MANASLICDFAAPVAFTAVSTWVLLGPIIAALRRRGVVDRPNHRSNHTKETARGAGIATVITIGGAILLVPRSAGTGSHLLAPFLLLAAVSFWDDVRPIPAAVRLLVQFALAMPTVFWLVGQWTPPMIVAVIWLVGYTNAFNFMDGINGISGFQAALTGLASAAIAIHFHWAPYEPPVMLSLATAGAAIGFLPWNFPNAQAFLGDVGSATFGFLLGALAVWIAIRGGLAAVLALVCLHANYLLDTGITLARRLIRGEEAMAAHRDHFYQRAARGRKSHSAVTIRIALLQLAASLAIVAALAENASMPALFCLTAGIVVLWGAHYLWCERALQPTSK